MKASDERLNEIETQIQVEYVYMTNVIWMFNRVKRLTEALDKCNALTHSWVIAEQTVNCKHTYNEIRETVRKALKDET